MQQVLVRNVMAVAAGAGDVDAARLAVALWRHRWVKVEGALVGGLVQRASKSRGGAWVRHVF